VFERLLAVNYLSELYITAAVLPHLRESRGLNVAVDSISRHAGGYEHIS
jgi:hypothetical protein